jgi:PAS domain S-box-containing protein
MSEEKRARLEQFGFPPWLPVAASLVLMVMVAFMAESNARNLQDATQWSRHSTQVILAARGFESSMLDMQRGLRGYVTLGDTNALAIFYSRAGAEPLQLIQLESLTFDNITQQKRLKDLAVAMNKLVAFDKRSVAIYRAEGFAGISKLDATGQSRAVFNNAYQVLNLFSVDEERLWDIRDASEQSQYQEAGHWLVVGSGLAALLLLLAMHLASRELAFRRRAEAKLKETLLVQNAIFASADYGIVTTDPEGIIQTFNPAAERLLGYGAAEVIGKETPMLWRDAQELLTREPDLANNPEELSKLTFETIAKKVRADNVDEGEWTFIRKDGGRFPSLLVITSLKNEKGGFTGFLGVFRDISERKKSEAERERLITELKNTIAHVKTLSGLIPICAWCKNVRSDTGYWQTVEQYVRNHSEASFSHGVCPSCAAKFKGDVLQSGRKPHPSQVPQA